jgi:hypothetical protein
MMVEVAVRTTKSSWVFCHTRLENSGAKGANNCTILDGRVRMKSPTGLPRARPGRLAPQRERSEKQRRRREEPRRAVEIDERLDPWELARYLDTPSHSASASPTPSTPSRNGERGEQPRSKRITPSGHRAQEGRSKP